MRLSAAELSGEEDEDAADDDAEAAGTTASSVGDTALAVTRAPFAQPPPCPTDSLYTAQNSASMLWAMVSQ